MVTRFVAALAIVGVVACGPPDKCGTGAECLCIDCPQARLTTADSGSTIAFPQGYRIEVMLPVAATGAVTLRALTVSDGKVLLVQQPKVGHALQFVTGEPGRARVIVAGTSFAVDVVVHPWPFGTEEADNNVLNPYNPVTVRATVGQELGILFYTSPGEPISVVSGDDRVVDVLDEFTSPLLSGSGHFGLFRAVGRGQTKVTPIPGEVRTPARATAIPLFPITVTVV